MELEVYKSINAVMAALAKDGISKEHKNTQQGYKFRGIDDIYNRLATLLSENALVICPIVKNRVQVERTTQKGSAIFYTSVDVDYTIVSSKDGSSFTTTICGEAMDNADKSTNKAMSAAYKYLCLQLFCIPTEGDNDADATTPPPVNPVLPANKKSPVEQFADLLKVKNMYNQELVDKFAKMSMENKRIEYERVRGL